MNDECKSLQMSEAIYIRAYNAGIPHSALKPQEMVVINDGTKIFKTVGGLLILYREDANGATVNFADISKK